MANAVIKDVLRRTRPAHKLGQRTDGELLNRFVTQKEEAAFALLVERHGRMLVGVCQRILGDPLLAEDSFQATFIVLARRASSLDVNSSLGPWLYAVARHIALKAKAQTRLRQDGNRQVTHRR
jgi:DNA-directed RNA polymerase specialized sigma24 family protein